MDTLRSGKRIPVELVSIREEVMLSLLLLIPIWDSHGGVGKEGHDPTVLPPRPRRGRMAGQRGVKGTRLGITFRFSTQFQCAPQHRAGTPRILCQRF